MTSDILPYIKLLHIIAMATWFAGSIMVPGDIRRSLALGGEHLIPMMKRVNIAERIGITSGMVTAITGFGMIFSLGGFAEMPFRIHIGFALTIITFFVGALFASPTWRRIAGIIERNGDIAEAHSLAKKMGVFMWIEHGLRTVILVLMVVRF